MNLFIDFLKRYRSIVVYLILGVLTTAINYAVYLPLHNILHLYAAVSNIIAWVAAVIFAFVTNKQFAFCSNDWSWRVVIPEVCKFTGCRLLSGLLETLSLLVFVDLLEWNGNVVKLIASIAVIIINYFASKLFVFRKQNT